MKKILVLFVALSSFTVGFSQSHNDDRYAKNDDRQHKESYGKDYRNDDSHNANFRHETRNRDYNNNWNRQQEMNRINREYDQRIQSYRNNRFLKNRERATMIRRAENDRNQK